VLFLKVFSYVLIVFLLVPQARIACAAEDDEALYYGNAVEFINKSQWDNLYSFLKKTPKNYRPTYRYPCYLAIAYYGLRRQEAASGAEEVCLAWMDTDKLTSAKVQKVKKELETMKRKCPYDNPLVCAQWKNSHLNGAQAFQPWWGGGGGSGGQSTSQTVPPGI